MAKSFSEGDKVAWNTSQGKTTGKVVERSTEEIEEGGRRVATSRDEPQYLVESDNMGERAVHEPNALEKVSG